MLAIAGIAPLNGWKQVGAVHWPQLHQHAFDMVGGELHHFTDGELRAVVPPEGWDGYMEAWPECASLVNEARHIAGLRAAIAAEAAAALAAAGGTGGPNAGAELDKAVDQDGA
jgi:hypothetical protein